MEKLSFGELEKETIKFIAQNNFMAFSTCSKNIATVRMVSIISDNLIIYFMTSKNMAKFHQLKDNPRIAFCIGNMQVEGTAEIGCHPLENPFFMENYNRVHENTFNIYGHSRDNIIIKVKPLLISFWKYNAEVGGHKDCLDIIQQEAYREFYN